MNQKSKLAGGIMACALIFAGQLTVNAQGRGRGGGGGGQPGGNPGIGRPSGVGVDGGLGTASDRSNGRSDRGLGTASDRSNGRSDAGLDRARSAQMNRQEADNELRDHPQMAQRLHTTANDLRSGFQQALATNPNLKFGQYVAATRLSANLGGRFPAVTRSAILSGLANGNSIGKTLQSLGVGKSDAKAAENEADREIKAAKKRP